MIRAPRFPTAASVRRERLLFKSSPDRIASITCSTDARSTRWERIPLEQAVDLVAERLKNTREAHWQQTNEEWVPVRRTMAIAHLGGATLDNEENYLIKELFNSPGIVQIENQARI